MRCPEVRDFVGSGFEVEDFDRRYPSRRVMKLVHSWGKISQAVWDKNYPYYLKYEDDSLDGYMVIDGDGADQVIADGSDEGDVAQDKINCSEPDVEGGGKADQRKRIGDEEAVGVEGDVAEDKINCRGDDVEGGGRADQRNGDEIEKEMGLVIENGWAIQKFGESKIENVILLVKVDERDKKEEPKPVKSAKRKAISPKYGKKGPKLCRGICTSSIFWSSRFGRGMCASVFLSPAVVRCATMRRKGVVV